MPDEKSFLQVTTFCEFSLILFRCAVDGIPWTLLGENLQDVKSPKQMIWEAVLGKEVIPVEQIPEDMHNVDTCPK